MAGHNELFPLVFAKGNRIVADTSTGGKIRYGEKKDV
jgi:hypothetical protein